MRISVRVEWDMGHRLPNHDGQCRHLHGHRYAAEVTVGGRVGSLPGAPDEGMVADFGPVKAAIRDEVAKMDHRFLVCERDPIAQSMRDLPGVVLVSFVPTAENIADALLGALRVGGKYDFVSVRLYETPTSWADAS